MGRHQFLITLLVICKKWTRTSTRRSLGGCAWLSLTRGLGCPVGVGWVGPAVGCRPCWSAGLWVCALGKYLDPVGDRDQYGPQNLAYGVLKFLGTVLMAWRCKES